MDGGGEQRADVAVVGAGAAGLALAWHLADADLDVVLVEPPPGPVRSPVRTWCSWQPPRALERGPAGGAASACWPEVSVVGPDGAAQRLDLSPLVYAMVRSTDYERVVGARLEAAPRVVRATAVVDAVVDDPAAPLAVVSGRDEQCRPVAVRARWVVDTRPPPPTTGGRTALLQHFRGWFVRTAEPSFDPTAAVLMDFRTPQPAAATSFGYVLPTSPHEALVEYTEFGRAPLEVEAYEAALRHYAHELLGLPHDLEVVAVEQGAIPMTDAPAAPRPGPRTVRIGAAGGATRPSTGYTFAAALRQAEAVALALREGRDPGPPAPYRDRHLWMDAVLLRALDAGRLDGARYFARLFRRNPVGRVLAFLDGRTSLADDLALMGSAPVLPMARTALELRRLPW